MEKGPVHMIPDHQRRLLPKGYSYTQGDGAQSHVLLVTHPDSPDLALTVFNLDLPLAPQIAEERCSYHGEFLCPLCFDIARPKEGDGDWTQGKAT